jgi:hypothetical protein
VEGGRKADLTTFKFRLSGNLLEPLVPVKVCIGIAVYQWTALFDIERDALIMSMWTRRIAFRSISSGMLRPEVTFCVSDGERTGCRIHC